MNADPAVQAQPFTGPDMSVARRVAITGSSGLIGSALVESLREDGYRVQRVVRSRVGPESENVFWDPTGGRIEAEKLEGVDAVVHLAGENVGQRWTDEAKRRIRDSRARGTRLLCEALASLEDPPDVLVSASGVGFFGDRGDELLDEESGSGDGFLAGVTREWEAATAPADRAGIRVVNVRFGVVLSGEGGALVRMLPPFKLGLGGKLGSGTQWMSWVALDDAVAAIRFAIETPALHGPVNVVAPEPVTNAEFTRAVGEVLGRPTLLSVPAPVLHLALGEMADEALLASQRVVPQRLIEVGFDFSYRDVRSALRAAL